MITIRRNSQQLISFCFALALIASSVPSGMRAQVVGGTIRGRVNLPPQVQVAPRAQTSRYRKTPAKVPPSVGERPEVTNVVVYLDGPGLEKNQSNSTSVVLDQKDAAFVPHVLPIVQGTQVRIVNRDKTYHNVFSLSKAKKFNIGRRPTGEEVPVNFEKSGEVQVFCDIHSNMSAIILVLENPMFVQPNDDGSFEIANIPPGQYTLNAWHERLSSPSKQVTIRPGETVTANFDFQ